MITPATDERELIIYAYTRLSADQEGRRVDHESQVRAVTELCEFNQWPGPTEWFKDNDLSAYREEVERPDWRRLLAAIQHVDRKQHRVAVVAYALDRLICQMTDMTELADTIEKVGGMLATRRDGPINTRVGGRDGYYFTGVTNRLERERISARTLEGIETAAIKGGHHGQPSYGWTRIWDGPTVRGRPQGREVVNEEQAEVLRWAARAVLAGRSLRELSRDLNERGVPAPAAGSVRKRDPVTKEPLAFASEKWSPAKLRQLLLRKRNIAIRSYTHDGVTAEYPAKWPPIYVTDDGDPDVDLFGQLETLFSNPERRTSQGSAIKHLLSGIATAPCGATVRTMVHSKTKSGNPRMIYTCPEDRCIGRAKLPSDNVVDLAVIRLFSDPVQRRMLIPDDDDASRQAAEKVIALKAKLESYRQAHKTGKLELEDYQDFAADARTKLAVAEAELRQLRNAPIYEDLIEADPAEVGAIWDRIRQGSLAKARAIIAATLEIRFKKAGRRGRGSFDPNSIEINIRTQA